MVINNPIFQREKLRTERLSKLLKVTQLVSGRERL